MNHGVPLALGAVATLVAGTAFAPQGSGNSTRDGDRWFAAPALDRVREQGEDALSRTTLAYLDPADFLRLAEPGYQREKARGVEDVLVRVGRFSYVPALWIVDRRDGTAVVTGHEGRHRARALQARGVRAMPVRLVASNLRWGEAERLPAWLYGEGEHGDNVVAMPPSALHPRSA